MATFDVDTSTSAHGVGSLETCSRPRIGFQRWLAGLREWSLGTVEASSLSHFGDLLCSLNYLKYVWYVVALWAGPCSLLVAIALRRAESTE